MSIATTADGQADLIAGGTPAAHGRRRVVGLFACVAVLALVCVLSLAIGTENVGLFACVAVLALVCAEPGDRH